MGEVMVTIRFDGNARELYEQWQRAVELWETGSGKPGPTMVIGERASGGIFIVSVFPDKQACEQFTHNIGAPVRAVGLSRPQLEHLDVLAVRLAEAPTAAAAVTRATTQASLAATHGAGAVVEEDALAETAGQENARRSAESYLEVSAFSRSGLIEQLEYGGFSADDATYAVDAVNANWNEQAAKAAESYLEGSAFSRSGLIEQLEYAGYTEEQAVYGVNQTGL